jgi:hypothetical protein
MGLPQVKIVPTIQLTKGGPPIMSAPEKNEEWDSDHKQKAMLAAYAEICKSYHAIDAFRMKLLGLLPLASLVGVFLIDRDKLVAGAAQTGAPPSELIGFASIFAAMLTLALFLYEVRGIRRSHNLIIEGEHIEIWLGIRHGQFHVCLGEHKHSSLKALNAKLISCIIYSLVFAGWFFITLRFGFGRETRTCALWATSAGSAIAIVTFLLVRKLTPP